MTNPTMEEMADAHFIPSIPSGFRQVPHRINIETSGNFGKDGYFDVIVERTEMILAEIERSLDDQLMVWCDVDVIFNQDCAGEIERLARGKDLMFQQENPTRDECNFGIQVIRRNTRTLIFYAQLRIMQALISKDDQLCGNQLLEMIEGVEWHANCTKFDSMNGKRILLAKARQLLGMPEPIGANESHATRLP